MTFLTDFADQAVILPMVAAVAAGLALQGWRRGALVWLGGVAVTLLAMLALKLVCLACWPVFAPMDIRSPSGHVAAAAVVAGGLAAVLLAWRGRSLALAAVVAAVIGATRLWLGVHSPAEVAIGAGVGLAGAALLLHFLGPIPRIRASRIAGTAVLAAVLFHGRHLPAEIVIRHTAVEAASLFTVCRAEAKLPSARNVNLPAS